MLRWCDTSTSKSLMETLPIPKPKQTFAASQRARSPFGSEPLPAAVCSKVGACLPDHKAPSVSTSPTSPLCFCKMTSKIHQVPLKCVTLAASPTRPVTRTGNHRQPALRGFILERWGLYLSTLSCPQPAWLTPPGAGVTQGSRIHPDSPSFGGGNQSSTLRVAL